MLGHIVGSDVVHLFEHRGTYVHTTADSTLLSVSHCSQAHNPIILSHSNATLHTPKGVRTEDGIILIRGPVHHYWWTPITTLQPHVWLHTTGKASLFTKIKSLLLPLPVPGPVSYFPIGGPAVVLPLPPGTVELNAATEIAGFPAGCLGCFPWLMEALATHHPMTHQNPTTGMMPQKDMRVSDVAVRRSMSPQDVGPHSPQSDLV
ncbi:hypothetical protein AAG570_007927 [Ranatra chinensis]|uniref:Uncharacterized protein n=1 Tax=Ranatra chinensis TaxID=642074 RepID=A0ABD0XTA3_9HEMI